MADELSARYQKIFDALWNDREIGDKIQAKAKELYPDVKTNADVFDPIMRPLKDQVEELTSRLKKEQEERAEERRLSDENKQKLSLEQSLDRARKNFSLTDEGFDKMVARMKETGNFSDADAAAAWVAHQTPPAPPPGPSWAPQNLNLFGSKNADEKFKQLHLDPSGYMDAELTEFVRDPDRYVAETRGWPN